MLRNILPCLIIIALVLSALTATAVDQPAGASPTPPARPAGKVEKTEEEKIGDKAAAELEKALKVIPNHPDTERLNRIANELAVFTERPGIHYTIKVVTSKAINAVSIPGGRIYITEGAVQATESEDELAAILAHEIAHNSLQHAMQEREKASRSDWGLMAGILAGILSGRGEVALMATQIQQGALNHYGRKAEMEADSHGLAYLSKSKYNSVAMLTVLEGLAAMEESRWHPDEINTGMTHPLARDRAKAVAQQLVKKGLDVTAQRRKVTDRYKLEVKPLEQNGQTAAEVVLNEKPVFAPAQADGATTPLQRAQNCADAIQKALQQGLQMTDLKLVDQGNVSLIQARINGQVVMLVKVMPGDAAFHKKTAHELASNAKKAIELAIYAENLSRPF